MEQVAARLRSYLLGWKEYFRLADAPKTFAQLEEWIRHRLRAIHLKHWKRGSTIFRELRARGMSVTGAARIASNGRRWPRNLNFSNRPAQASARNHEPITQIALPSPPIATSASIWPASGSARAGHCLSLLGGVEEVRRRPSGSRDARAGCSACSKLESWIGYLTTRLRFEDSLERCGGEDSLKPAIKVARRGGIEPCKRRLGKLTKLECQEFL
jgi:Group II intron, maturase-specific domain